MLYIEWQEPLCKPQDSEQSSTDEDSDNDYSVDYEGDDTSMTALLSHGDGYSKAAASERQNGVYLENRPVDGLANNVSGPRYELFMLRRYKCSIFHIIDQTYLLRLFHADKKIVLLLLVVIFVKHPNFLGFLQVRCVSKNELDCSLEWLLK